MRIHMYVPSDDHWASKLRLSSLHCNHQVEGVQGLAQTSTQTGSDEENNTTYVYTVGPGLSDHICSS